MGLLRLLLSTCASSDPPLCSPPTRRPSYKPSTFPSSPVQVSLPPLIIFNPPCALPLILKPITPPLLSLGTFHHAWLLQPPYFGRSGRECKISEVGFSNVTILFSYITTFFSYVTTFSSYVRACQPPGRNFSTCPILCKEMQALGGKHPGAKYK